MTDIQIMETGVVRFKKKLWHESESILAKCFGFDTAQEAEKGIIFAHLSVTAKQALYNFIRLSFKSFSEAHTEAERRDAFYSQIEEFYSRKDHHVTEVMKARLPYFDMMYAHQGDSIRESFHRTYNFLALEMGLGKTIVSASLSRVHQVERTVIMCPAAVKWNWYRDLTERFKYNELFFTILDATKRRTMIALKERFVVINYDIVGKFEKHLCASPIGHFILDEAHLLKNHNSQRYKAVKRIIEQNPNAKITFLSGTPIKNRVNDVFAYLKLIGHELGLSYKKFLDEYTIKTNGRGGERVSGGKNLQDLYIKLSNFMIRKTKEECLDLPDKIYFSYKYELDDYRDEYNKIIAELAKLKDYKGLSGNLHSLNIITSKAKIPGIIELAEEIIASGKKVVIFGGYKEPLSKLEEYFGNRCVKIDGSVDAWSRDQLVTRFTTDETCEVFLGNMIAAGVGINLTVASDVIYMNFPFTPSELYQSTDRLHRIGQKSSVNVHYTFCDDSIDEYIYDIIVDKELDINALIDQGKEVNLRENFNEILMKKLLKRDDVTDIIEPKNLPVVEEKKVEEVKLKEGDVNVTFVPSPLFNEPPPDFL